MPLEVHAEKQQSDATGVTPSVHMLKCAREQITFFLTKSLLPREFPKKFWCRGGGLFFFAPKSFVGKHFIGQIQLRAFLEAKRGRWVYEGSGLKTVQNTFECFSIDCIALLVCLGCVYSAAPLWVGASYSV
jgi:hypothetical protein